MCKAIMMGWVVLSLSMAAFGQADFSGNWAPLYHEDYPERIPGPEVGDYMGIPINDAARLRADSYDADRISVVTEYQCRPHGADYSMRGLANMRVDNIIDPDTQRLVGIHTRMNFQEMERTIWLDGRPHPPELAPHTFQGFSTGTWDYNMLNTYTTHLKESYLRRNGLPRSDKATFTEHWVRHGNYLSVTTVITDPAFLTEPLVRSQEYRLALNQQIPPYPCDVVEEVDRPKGVVPHTLPGTNTFVKEFADRIHVPEAVVRSGAETMYPEIRKKLK